MKREVPSLDKPYKKHRKLSPDEVQVWRETMGDASPLPLGEADFVSETQLSLRNPVRALSARREPSPNPLPQAGEGFVRGKQAPHATLDLHGHTLATAHAALVRFLAAARHKGLRRVIIITGKGKAGPESLRALLPRWLEESPCREAVVACDVAGPRRGGEGAWLVRLRKGG